MGFWSAVVLIVMIIAISALIMDRNSRRADSRQGKLQADERRALEQERDDARQELAELKNRVQVLERIATDPARRTAEEIEKLRDD